MGAGVKSDSRNAGSLSPYFVLVDSLDAFLDSYVVVLRLFLLISVLFFVSCLVYLSFPLFYLSWLVSCSTMTSSVSDVAVHSSLALEHPRPLKIAIVGAGIGGLSAAIGLRRAGHQVDVCSPNFLMFSSINKVTLRSTSCRGSPPTLALPSISPRILMASSAAGASLPGNLVEPTCLI